MAVEVGIIGAGGHGRELLQALRAAIRAGAGLEFMGFYDDAADLGPVDRLGAIHRGPVSAAVREGLPCYLGLGGGDVKRRLAEGVVAAPPLVHPKADVGEDVRLEDGAVIFAQSTVTTNITVGRHAHVGRGVAVGHDSELGDFCSIMPLASISGNVKVGEGAFIGTGALVRQGLSIGERATVGMGSVVLCDVPEGVTVVGSPATLLERRR